MDILKKTPRAGTYFFTVIVANDPSLAFAAEMLRRDRSATVDLRLPRTTDSRIFTASDRAELCALAPTLLGTRASIAVDYDKSVPTPEATVVLPMPAARPRRRAARRRAA